MTEIALFFHSHAVFIMSGLMKSQMYLDIMTPKINSGAVIFFLAPRGEKHI